MKRKMVVALIVLVITAGIIPSGVLAAPGKVKVTLPGFNVTLNGVRVDNKYRQYPLIVYRDITYFPMTYFDCRFLGIETYWNQNEGLDIGRTGITGAYRDYRADAENAAGYTAEVPAFNVRINGKAIDNAKEEYPLLLFRDVTYFPMTWRFCVEELGWEYEFSKADGLKINSSNQRLQKYALPGNTAGQLVVSDGYIYYDGEGVIYQTPLESPENARQIYQLPQWSYGDSYVPYGLSKNDGEAWLNFHQGGAAMGTDFYIRLNPDGTTREVERGYLTFKTFRDITVKADQWSPPVHNNLMIKSEGQEEYRRIGNPDYLYGWDYEIREDGSEGGSPSDDIYLIDDIVYVLAINKSKEVDGSRIYRVNINNDNVERISDLRVNSFRIDRDNIYCFSEGDLYQISLEGGAENRLNTIGTVSKEYSFRVLEGALYYVNGEDNRLYTIGKNAPINPDGKVSGLKMEEDYLICTFEEENENPYRIIVIDNDGEVIFKTSDVADINCISIEDGSIYYLESNERFVYSTDLAG